MTNQPVRSSVASSIY